MSFQVKANEALYEDKAKLWLKRDKEETADDHGGNQKKGSLDYDDDNQVGDDAKSGSHGNKDNDSR